MRHWTDSMFSYQRVVLSGSHANAATSAREWTPIGGFPGWVGTTIEWRLEPADDGGTTVHFAHSGWQDDQADGEMAMCGYTWAMIIDRLAAQAARGERAPYFKADAPLPR